MLKRNTLSSILILFLVAVWASFLVSSCKKESVQPVTYGLPGLWSGTIADAVSGPQDYNMSIKPGGKITFEAINGGQQHFGVGTWTLNGTAFTSNVTTLYGASFNVGTKQTFTAVFDSSTGTLSSGKWANTSPANNSGTFSLTRVN